jgi:cell division cycle protein 20 (cofactor of APC complex)
VIASDPEKILDAPNLKDDYYLNLIEWGENGIISVSLGSNLYLLLQNGETQNLMNLENDQEYISSVSWMGKTNCLAVGLSDSLVKHLKCKI